MSGGRFHRDRVSRVSIGLGLGLRLVLGLGLHLVSLVTCVSCGLRCRN